MNQTKRMEEEAETLRTLSESLAESVPWTDELEGGRLSMDVSGTDGIERRVALSPLSVLAGSEEQSVPPRYPALDGFGSLDVSELPQAVKTQLDGFCAAITTDGNADSYMAPESLYSLALFYNDVAEHLAPQKQAEQEAARAKAAQQEAEAKKAESGKKKKKSKKAAEDGTATAQPAQDAPASPALEATTAPKTEKPKPDFDDAMYGAPFVAVDFVQVPVRFSGRFASADVAVFFTKDGASWKIDQLQIRKWGAADGK